MILFIDNYDSFTYNLVQYCGSINPDIKVVRNDEITVDEIRKLNPTHIILSPGPGYPKDAGICEDVIRELKGEYPITSSIRYSVFASDIRQYARYSAQKLQEQ